MTLKLSRTTAILMTVALLAAALIGFTLGRANSTHKTVFKPTASVGPPLLPKSGFYPGYASVAYLAALESWAGRSAQYVVQFGDVRSGSAFESSVWGEVVNAGALQTIAGRVTLVESVPVAFGNFLDTATAVGQATARNQLQATVNGTSDASYLRAAQYLKSGGFGNAVIRLGWEFDGGWMPWSSPGNQALFITAYKHVHDIFKSVSSGFLFDWNGSSGYLQGQVGAYPGDAYVDIVGLDVYDKGMGGATAWNSTTKAWSNPAAAWAKVLPNLQDQKAFAVAHGKRVSFPEWALTGVSPTAPNNVGGDDPTFIQGMYDWIHALPATGPGSLVYQSYFNEDTPDGNHRINVGYFPNASARYRALFSTSDTSVPTTTTLPPVIQPPATTTPKPATTTTTVPAPTTTSPAPTTTTVAPAPTTTVTSPGETSTTEPAPSTTVPGEATFSYTVTCGVTSHVCAIKQ